MAVQETAGSQISDTITHSWLYSIAVILNKLIPETFPPPYSKKKIIKKHSIEDSLCLNFFNLAKYIPTLKIFSRST